MAPAGILSVKQIAEFHSILQAAPGDLSKGQKTAQNQHQCEFCDGDEKRDSLHVWNADIQIHTLHTPT